MSGLCGWCSKVCGWFSISPGDKMEGEALMESDGPSYRTIEDDPEDAKRAFVIAKHAEFGYMILKSFKTRKGLHGQLPGGHKDSTDSCSAFTAARELFEETGIDVRENLDRLKVRRFPNGGCLLKDRVYFGLELENSDATGTKKPDTGEAFSINMSHEHVGYSFEKEAAKAAEMVAM
mmetsp:Transcript_5359/g.9521  ORF Transcript_5359/g.9521 Transcript_5359/m.9521 type:complete len:177 (+) Transcript_5359:729-1259(+)